MREKEITLKQTYFVFEFMKDGNAKRAAKAAGYSPNGAKQRAYELLKNPKIKELIDKIKAEAFKEAAYGYEKAMIEIEEDIALVKKEGSLMALPRLRELKMRLNGLLIDKHQIQMEVVDMAQALEDATKRLFVMPAILTNAAKSELLPLESNRDGVGVNETLGLSEGLTEKG